LALALLWVLLFKPPPAVWYVESSLAASWGRILGGSAAPPFTRIRIFTGELPRRVSGFLLTWQGPAPAGEGGPVLYSGLSQNREYQGALALALDPWMVFYRHSLPPLSRERLREGGEGTLLLPGEEGEARRAWEFQLTLEKPGRFSLELEGPSGGPFPGLPGGLRFQEGAESCRWPEALELLFREEPAWLYAPLSRVLTLSVHRQGLLAARPFPGPPDWNEFGLEAAVLWAIPLGMASREREDGAAWLRAGETQSLIAGELRAVPAHPGGSPHNPLARDAQLAWLRSSFVWTPGAL
jgi:hypothetical protein